MRVYCKGSAVCVVAATAVLIVQSCGSQEERVRNYEDEGSVCLLPEQADASAGGEEVALGEPAVIRVLMEPCGSFCAEIDHAECEAAVEDNTIQVTSHARTREEIDDDEGCPTACLSVSASCSVGPLDEGTYTIEHGNSSRSVVVPGMNECEHFDL